VSASIKVRTELSGDLVTVRVLINHPMLAAQQAEATGGAHYITDLEIERAGAVVLRADWGPGIARNPLVVFRCHVTNPASELQLRWRDNRGGSDELTVLL
jgi:thiosulfate oxidation carrier complex protein SoxZ